MCRFKLESFLKDFLSLGLYCSGTFGPGRIAYLRFALCRGHLLDEFLAAIVKGKWIAAGIG
jgi:hypothetical protein